MAHCIALHCIEKSLDIFDGLLHLDKSLGKNSVVHPLRAEGCYTRVLSWARREKKRPVELAKYGKIPYLASFTGHIFSSIAQLRPLVWQLLRFTKKYTFSRRIYYSIAKWNDKLFCPINFFCEN